MAKPDNIAHVTVWGAAWNYASFYSGKLMVFISTIILARLLTKDDFGVAGYALVVISFLDILSGLGVGPALIYHDRDPEANDSAFWLGLAAGTGVFALSWFGAPLAGLYFKDPRAIEVVRLLALTFPISALGNVHDFLLRKMLAFDRKFIPELVRALTKGLVSILFATLGFGARSLIFGQIACTIAAVISLWLVVPWRPRLRVAAVQLKKLLSYGWKIVTGDTLGVFLENSDYLLIGRFLGSAALGVYTVAFRIPDLLVMQFCSIISRVVFPVYAALRDDASALSRGFLATLQYLSLITIPLGLGTALIARPFVQVFFTEKWIEAAPVMAAIAIYGLMLSLSYNAGDVYKAQGRPEILTLLSLLRALVLIPALLWAVTVPKTILAVGWTHAVVAFIAGIAELSVARHLLKMPSAALIQALRPAVLSGLLMSLAITGVLVGLASSSPVVQLSAGILSGGLVYLGSLWILQRQVVLDARNILRGVLVR